MTTIALTPMQDDAVRSIQEWYHDKDRQLFHLAGYAGTGKSTLVDFVIRKLKLKLTRVAFACYTGKAALNLTQKANGKYKGQTIHRLIYKLDSDDKGKPIFIKKNKKDLSQYKLIIIDEWSQIDADMFVALKSFGIKILFIGDQGQLPPIGNTNNKELQELRNNPDFSLTEIHRQAEGNPIIYLSMLARTKQPINYGWYGENHEVLVINRMQWEAVKHEVYTSADQIICAKNKTRQGLNQDIRQYLGYHTPLPQSGDKMICTRNNWGKTIGSISMVNGMTGFVENIKYDVQKKHGLSRGSMEFSFRPDFSEETFDELLLVNDHFTGNPYKLFGFEYSIYSDFDYGYAITCHKSQGSQWDKVVVISEVLRPEDHHRWLYTAITRSSEKLVLVI
jgi:exodeoxyribonuclease V